MAAAKLTRAQELFLIKLGIQSLNLSFLEGLDSAEVAKTEVKEPKKRGRKRNQKWSPEQHKKFRETMAARWAEHRAKKESK